MSILVKVCGMREDLNIRALCQLPIDFIGFIFYEQSARYCPQLPQDIPSTIKKTGVFVNADQDYIEGLIQQGLDAVQLHGKESPSLCGALSKQALVIKAFGIHAAFDWHSLEAYEQVVDYFLFDTSSAQHGGTGQSFDWQVLQQYTLSKPYFLSGGLSLENLPQAIELANSDPRLIGLDLNSKFEILPAEKNIHELAQALKLIHHE